MWAFSLSGVEILYGVNGKAVQELAVFVVDVVRSIGYMLLVYIKTVVTVFNVHSLNIHFG
jgi:hypothetical protein